MTTNPDDENARGDLGTAALRLGEIHWHILRAADLIEAQTVVKTKVEGMGGYLVDRAQTALAKDVGRDEINWWISKKETSLDELRAQSQRALDAAQVLQRAARELKHSTPASEAELYASLRQFAENRSAEIDTLLQYVQWLTARDPMAPSILFTYRVWGSTRRSDRWPEVDLKATEDKSPDTIRYFAEIVLGLRSRILSALEKAHYDIGADIWEHMEATGQGKEAKIEIPVDRVIRLASRMAFDECAVYFTEIRDSLRNILLDIDKFVEQQNLVHSDRFWRDFVSKAVRTKKTEPQLWDFKETLTIWHAESGTAKEAAKVTFAEDVASLANGRGGVLIVGVTDRREVVGIGDNPHQIESRLKFARDVISNHLDYDREVVSFRQILLPDRNGVEKVCLVIIVAQACDAAGVHDGKGRYTYPVRRETGIERVSRTEIASPKAHMKSDNLDFLSELNSFIP
jgi:Putative DNA-binding domain